MNVITGSLCLNFFAYFAEMSLSFLMKINKRKAWKCLKSVKEFSRRFDLENAKLMSVS